MTGLYVITGILLGWFSAVVVFGVWFVCAVLNVDPTHELDDVADDEVEAELQQIIEDAHV